ncbi:hypothetical protein DF024_19935 [Burkholderia cenocepacia]|nr:hypothetical protein DF024_19935 [Burkholderia cenocepacia]
MSDLIEARRALACSIGCQRALKFGQELGRICQNTQNLIRSVDNRIRDMFERTPVVILTRTRPCSFVERHNATTVVSRSHIYVTVAHEHCSGKILEVKYAEMIHSLVDSISVWFRSWNVFICDENVPVESWV